MRRGNVYFSDENFFRVSRNITRFDGRGIEEKIKIIYTITNKKENEYHQPSRGVEVLMRYHDLRAKEGRHTDERKNLPFEILTLRGGLIYN